MIYKTRLTKQSLIVFLLTILASFQLTAQNIASTPELKELKTSDESRILNVKLTGVSEEGAMPVFEAKIDFFTCADGKSESLGTATTNRNGQAMLKLAKGTRFLKDKEGITEVKASFTGLGKLSSSQVSVKFKELNLQITLSEKDSLNTIQILASAIGQKGENIPLKETTFNLYVQGLFTKLKI